MIRKLNNILLTNAPLKIISLIFGYTFWYIFSSTHTMNIWLTVPLCFDAVPEKMNIIGPDQITIKIAGKREFLLPHVKSLAAHVNAQQLSAGVQKLTINEDMLLLPETIKLIHCYPISVEVTHEPDGEQAQDIAQGKTA